MKYFKFACPECQVHIEAPKEGSGRQIKCPKCQTLVTIPPPASQKSKIPTALPTKKPKKTTTIVPKVVKKLAGETKKIPNAVEAKGSTSVSTSADSLQAASHRAKVADLDSAVKLEVVRAARQRIADQSTWIQGVDSSGQNVYAVKMEKDEPIAVDVASGEATRHSLMGAILLELYLRNVTPTANGRADFLDQEIVAAIREALRQEKPQAERQSENDPLARRNPMDISHGQCLAALEILQRDYEQQQKSVDTPTTQPTAEVTTFSLHQLHCRIKSDSVVTSEEVLVVTSEEVLEAVYEAFKKLERRVKELEKKVLS
jgi:hypothetical protein